MADVVADLGIDALEPRRTVAVAGDHMAVGAQHCSKSHQTGAHRPAVFAVVVERVWARKNRTVRGRGARRLGNTGIEQHARARRGQQRDLDQAGFVRGASGMGGCVAAVPFFEFGQPSPGGYATGLKDSADGPPRFSGF